jgi:hypothetical protein
MIEPLQDSVVLSGHRERWAVFLVEHGQSGRWQAFVNVLSPRATARSVRTELLVSGPDRATVMAVVEDYFKRCSDG